VTVALTLLSARDAHAVASVTYVVDTTLDTNLTACTGAAGDCTLRGAINASNAHTSTDTPDRIHFNIPSGGQKTITPASGLPPITDSLVIDAFTQPGVGMFGCSVLFNGGRCININGVNVPAGPVGLSISGNDVTIKGLAIYNYSFSDAILVNSPASNVTLTQNYLGMASGLTAKPNHYGIVVGPETSGVTIGGSTGSDGNLISGNSSAGVVLNGNGAIVEGNLVGTEYGGSESRGSPYGISVSGIGNIVGGTSAGARNVISGNGVGVFINGSQNSVQGNYIGTNSAGTSAVNNETGIHVEGAQNTIGGTAPGAGNLISGNVSTCTCVGVEVAGTDNTIAANIIGLKANGTEQLQNVTGIAVKDGAQNTTIGGSIVAARNVISGNLTGIDIGAASNTVIAGNYIGTNVAGDAAVGNSEAAIHAFAQDAVSFGPLTIGGTGASRNVISGNDDGITLSGYVTGITIRNNYIGLNAAGTATVGNQSAGIALSAIASVGEDNSIIGNVLAGNDNGIKLSADGAGSELRNNVISGNVVGLDAAGSGIMANGEAVILVATNNGSVHDNTIDDSSGPNVISGNSGGVELVGDGVHDNLVIGNLIGTGPDGRGRFGNTAAGVFVQSADSNTIASNTIGANGVGVSIFGGAEDNLVQGNFIGTNADLDSGLGNDNGGVAIDGSAGNTVGNVAIPRSGAGPAGNVIRNNQGNGVTVSGPTAVHNMISANSIDDNGALGIEIEFPANGSVAPPIIDSAVSGNGSTRITGQIHDPAFPFLLEFFASPSCDTTGSGEGRDYLGSGTPDAQAADTTFDVTVPGSLAGKVITATVTDDGYNTSAFSTCFTAIGATPTPSPTPSPTTTPPPTASPTATGAVGILGDADCDNDVDLEDMIAALTEFAGVDPGASCDDRADADCDNDVDAEDALRIAAHVANVALTPPFGCRPLGT
jgi:parallel beta-helix repeat protein